MKGKVSVTVRPMSSLDEIIQGVEQIVRGRAYELYVERGRQPGRELEDWQTASAELLREPQVILSESEVQTTVEFYLTDEEVRDTELLASRDAILLISKPRETVDAGPPSRTFKLVSLTRPIDVHSIYADFGTGKLFCAANAAQSTPALKATA